MLKDIGLHWINITENFAPLPKPESKYTNLEVTVKKIMDYFDKNI